MANGRRPAHLAEPALKEAFLVQLGQAFARRHFARGEEHPYSGVIEFIQLEFPQQGIEVRFYHRRSWPISLTYFSGFSLDDVQDRWRTSRRWLNQGGDPIWHLSRPKQSPEVIREILGERATIFQPFWTATRTPSAAIGWAIDTGDRDMALITPRVHGSWFKASRLRILVPEPERASLTRLLYESAARHGITLP